MDCTNLILPKPKATPILTFPRRRRKGQVAVAAIRSMGSTHEIKANSIIVWYGWLDNGFRGQSPRYLSYPKPALIE